MNNQININDYVPLIHSIIKKFNKNLQEDLFGECYIQLHQLSERYDESKGCFQTFAYKRLYFTCVDYVTKNNLNHYSIDTVVNNEEGDEVTFADSLESDLNLEDELIKQDFLNRHNDNLTDVEKFIQEKYYEDGLSVKEIIRVYQPFHLFKNEKTIRKILKK
ncbi:MAG: sigma-70 family RNA polymerase sigma factor [Aequorivita sp.]|nr:sigma-70 family RNA polymerase sigma factor [Aequorivita sp.]